MQKAACGGVRLSSPSLYHPLSVCLSIHIAFFSFSFFLPVSLSSSSIFPHYWVLITAVIGNSPLCMCSHTNTHTRALPSCCKSLWQCICVCVVGAGEREIWRDKDNERRRVSELQANSPTPQSVCCVKVELGSQTVII